MKALTVENQFLMEIESRSHLFAISQPSCMLFPCWLKILHFYSTFPHCVTFCSCFICEIHWFVLFIPLVSQLRLEFCSFLLDRPNKTKDFNVKLHNMFIWPRVFLLHSQALLGLMLLQIVWSAAAQLFATPSSPTSGLQDERHKKKTTKGNRSYAKSFLVNGTVQHCSVLANS